MDKLKDLRTLELLEGIPAPKINSSQLYNLKPIGLGTPYVESLTSYIVRLAHAHMTIPRWLVKYEVFPESSILDKYFTNNTIWKNSNTLNSNGDWASEWVTIMQELTSRKDLIFLTLFPFSDVLPSMMLTKRKLAWCAHCYDEWREKETIVYNPLIWHICGLEICGEHQKPLQSQCPHCQKEQEIMGSQMCVGHCQYCGVWLGNIKDFKHDDSSWDWQIWIVKQLEDLFTNVSLLPEVPIADNVMKANFAKLPDVINSNKVKLAKEIPISASSLSKWIKGKESPLLINLLKVCYRLNISVLEWLTQENIDFTLAKKEKPKIVLPLTKTFRKPLNKELVERLLRTVGDSSQEPPMTIKELAEILDYSPHTLAQKFSEPCEIIKENGLQYRKKTKKFRLEKLREDIRTYVFELNEQGICPTQGKVQRGLDKPALFKSPDARKFYKEAVAELESITTG